MFKTLAASVPRDRTLPDRAWRLDVLTRFLDGTIYDVLPYEFHQERTNAGEYIPIAQRAPSVRYAILKTVVNDSVSFLFSEGRFPAVNCADDKIGEASLKAIIKDSKLNAVMLEAAQTGSVGSVCIWVRVLRNRLFFKALPTTYLTPEFEPEAPDTLRKVTEQYKVRGDVLSAAGYDIGGDDLALDFWFQRIWDASAETWFLPWKVLDDQATPTIDTAKTVTHGLGFVPMVWVKNLPGGDEIDGACTFRAAIESSIEIDYQLSQAGRGLKYSSSPTLVLKDPGAAAGSTVHVAGDALLVPTEGDAKLLEISGDAAAAVIEFVREVRKLALESVGGSRADSDKLSAATSGRAMELMNQPLIGLADKLRSSYGEGALFDLLIMAGRLSRKFPLVDRSGRKILPVKDTAEISLIWPRWYAPTADDRQADAIAITTLKEGGVMSAETAVNALAADYDIEDVPAELARIKADASAIPAPIPANPAQ
jgi:hypothetical protein